MTPDQSKGMHGQVETVKVKTSEGFMLINKVDFDKSVHELVEPVEEQTEQKSEQKSKKK